MDEVDLQLAKEHGELIGRVRTAKWIQFLLTYKSLEDVNELIEKLIMRDVSSDSRLLKLERY